MSQLERLSSVVGPADANWPLLIVGVCMIVAGVAVPGAESQAAVALIVLGAGLTVGGALAPQIRQLDIGLQGIKVSRDDGTAIPMPWLAAEAKTLYGIAHSVLGNGDSARHMVEEVLTKVRRYRGQIPQGQRDVATFKTLVAELERAENRMWLRGSRMPDGPNPIQNALSKLALPVRLAFALELELPIKAVAEILDRPEAEVATDVEVARGVLAPYVEGNQGDGDV